MNRGGYRYDIGGLIRARDTHFVVEKQLGAGGMGEAYKVLNKKLGEVAVMKMPNAAVLASAKERERFEWEARAGAQIKHPNLAPVRWLGELLDGTPYFLMDFIAGDTIRQAIQRADAKRLSIRSSLAITAQVLQGLEALHDRGIVHQDVKPSNVILSRQRVRGTWSDVAILIDLGVMRVLSIDSHKHSWAGTPPYSAPEQIRGGEVGPWTDVFAVSVMFFEMLAGETPYARYGSSPAGAIARIDVEAPMLTDYGEFPTSVVEIARQGLVTRAGDRYREAYAMQRAIEDALAALPADERDRSSSTRARRTEPPKAVEQFSEIQLGAPTDPISMPLAELHARIGLTEQSVVTPGGAPVSPFDATSPISKAADSPRTPAMVEDPRPATPLLAPSPPLPSVAPEPLPMPATVVEGRRGASIASEAVTVPPQVPPPPPDPGVHIQYADVPSRRIPSGTVPIVRQLHARELATFVETNPHRGPRGVELVAVRAREAWRGVVDRDPVAKKSLSVGPRGTTPMVGAPRRARPRAVWLILGALTLLGLVAIGVSAFGNVARRKPPATPMEGTR